MERTTTLHAAGSALQQAQRSPSNGTDENPQLDAAASAEGSIPKHLVHKLEDAESLIVYAAEIGIDIDEDVRRNVVETADAAMRRTWSQERSLDLLAALTALSSKLHPVSGESLRKCERSREAATTLTTYKWVAIVLAGLIVPYSIAALLASARCEAIQKDIESANGLALALAVEMRLTSESPSSAEQSAGRQGEEELRRLQQFTATCRALDARASVLKSFAFGTVSDPFE